MWQKKPGHQHDHLCGRTLQHNIRLENTVTGGEHLLHLLLHVEHCATCKRPFPQSDLGLLDPGAALEEAMVMLNPHHEAVLAYSRKHNVPVLLGDSASHVPDGHRITKQADQRFLHPPPKENR